MAEELDSGCDARPPTGRNILIFSDGTGMSGGITFDEDRTNIYKLYRATRCAPDSCIHPDQQVAFYDPGLGSPADGGFMFGKTGRWLYNIVSKATGLGLTANVIDCYAALIRLYRDGEPEVRLRRHAQSSMANPSWASATTKFWRRSTTPRT
jgi:uncharacterized protein (DUF2235 family)